MCCNAFYVQACACLSYNARYLSAKEPAWPLGRGRGCVLSDYISEDVCLCRNAVSLGVLQGRSLQGYVKDHLHKPLDACGDIAKLLLDEYQNLQRQHE